MGTKECGHESAMSRPSAGEAGHTGDWRTERPVVDQAKCTAVKTEGASCFRCWLYCPEAVIPRQVPITIDLDYCKGCAICAEECPTDAITMQSEAVSDADGDGSGGED